MTYSISLELKLLLTLEERGLLAFSTDDAKNILKTTDSSVWHILHGLVRKKRIERIERGKYVLIPAEAGVNGGRLHYPEVIAPKLVDNYYVGFWSAMKHWDMTEQIPYTVFIATTKRKQPMTYGYQRFKFVTLSEKKMFGIIQKKIYKEVFNVSSMEKTIIDGLMHPEYCGSIDEVMKGMWNVRNEVNWNTMVEYAERTGISAVLKRLGYLYSALELDFDVLKTIKKKIAADGYSYLDPSSGKTPVEYSKEYGLIINYTKHELLDWMEH